MGFWGWRPLVIAVFISVWVVGCNIVSDAAPRLSPTPSPRVTLTVRRLATATPTPPARTPARPTATQPATAPQSSPTPVTYVVQAGDTFGGIALRLGIDVNALREANSEVDPRALQPGQTLIVPVTGEAAPIPAATSTPPALALPDPACYETPVGTLLCLGAVENSLDFPLENVSVAVELFDKDNSPLAAVDSDIEQAVILPGSLAPYRAVFSLEAEQAALAHARLLRASAAVDLSERFVDLEATDEAMTLVDGRYVVSATLRNPGPDAALSVRAVVTLTDALGQVVGYRLSQVAARLDAGASLPIRLEIVTQRVAPEIDYRLYVEARRDLTP